MNLKTIAAILLFVGFSAKLFAQKYSFVHDSILRTYLVHLPAGYTSQNQYPLVLNLHGLNADAALQQTYTRMDATADSNHFIVVYPQGVNNTWNILNNQQDVDDTGFISTLIDSLANRYSIDQQKVFATGLSMGGFMCYTLACALERKLAAIAVVSGNMDNLTKLQCKNKNGMPVMHIHGTSDGIVNINGAWGITPVQETIDWWVATNLSKRKYSLSTFADNDKTDGCTAEKYEYADSGSKNQVIFLKITGGGHTWPGAGPVVLLGNTCNDFKANTEILNFFSNKKQVGITPDCRLETLTFYPNPSSGIVYFSSDIQNLKVISAEGKCWYEKPESQKWADLSALPKGVYFVQFNRGENPQAHKRLLFLF